ncbi:signal transduction histidine kinase [Compostimonas suwonensis]|uniref:histidine kinase n=2 Tax=Compostimonas suwonensis TaxID=1048394 RepID=A0A2M9C4H5_9MICO|nr:signal transduction histidine kinase [Compostimonas suwonensis]
MTERAAASGIHADAGTDPFADDWRRPRPSPAGYRRDALIALALVIGTGTSLVLYRTAGIFADADWWWSAIWLVAMTVPLAFRRRWPEIVALVATAAFMVGGIAEVSELLFSNISLYLALYTVGAWSRRRALAAWLRILVVVVMFVWLFSQLIVVAGQPHVLPDLSRSGTLSPYLAYGLIQIITNLLYFGAAYIIGDLAYRAARERARLEARTHELAAERERSAAQAIALERVRIARELHDVVAHHVSVMGVQAGAARRVLERDPQQAREALGAIESNARTAVDELRLILHALRSDEQDAAASAPLPDTVNRSTSTRGLARLEELVSEVADAGLPTTLSIVGEARPVSPTIGVSVYRIAQEALTNTRKHAGATATAEVRLRYLDELLELEVSDTGIGPAAGASAASHPPGASEAAAARGVSTHGGLGHLGMRERVAAVGGTLELGARTRGGYLVRARFPLPSSREWTRIGGDDAIAPPIRVHSREEEEAGEGA